MNDLGKARKVARVRDVERRLAAMSLAASTAQICETETRMVRLERLSQLVTVGRGVCSGDTLGSAGECASRLLIGCIAVSAHRSRQIEQVEYARQSFAIADARAGIAQRQLSTATRSSAKDAELRASLKMPVRGGMT